MAVRRIRTFPDPVLREVAKPVEKIDEEVRQTLSDMAETMYASNGVGLAAPQIGDSRRLVVIDVGRAEPSTGLLKLINPVITDRFGTTKGEEGCLSLPDLLVEVERNEKVVVEALLPDGEPIRIEAEGLLSIALQHEIDHLNGVLLVDRLSSLRRSLYLRKRQKEDALQANERRIA
jgi:peptide deformylase